MYTLIPFYFGFWFLVVFYYTLDFKKYFVAQFLVMAIKVSIYFFIKKICTHGMTGENYLIYYIKLCLTICLCLIIEKCIKRISRSKGTLS